MFFHTWGSSFLARGKQEMYPDNIQCNAKWCLILRTNNSGRKLAVCWPLLEVLLICCFRSVAKSCPVFSAPGTVARRAPPAVALPRQDHWSGWPFPSPGGPPGPGAEPTSPDWRADSLPRSHRGGLFPNWLSIKFWKPTWWGRSCYYPWAVNKEGGVESVKLFFRNYGVGGWQSQKSTSGCHYPVPKPAGASWGGAGGHSRFLQILHICLQPGKRPHSPPALPAWGERSELRRALPQRPRLRLSSLASGQIPCASRVVSLWGMHKRRLLVSRLFLLCGSLQKKQKLPDSIFQERPFKKGRMQSGQEGNLCAPLEAIFPASAFVKRTLAFVFRLEWVPLTSLLRFRISKTSQCSIPSLQRKSDLHVSITHPDAKSSERTAFSLLFHQSSFPL